MAIASFVCAFFCSPLGIIFGHVALSQIKKTNEGGKGLATAGLVISYLAIFIVFFAL
jgi:peptidyl-prolyl cis-trans isomerase B (cyclophilin B)